MIGPPHHAGAGLSMKENVKYPRYIGVSDVTTRSFEHMRVEAHFDGQPSLMFDEPEGFDIGDPPDLRGRSRGWTPVHAQLAALGGCTAITVTVVARDQKFNYANLATKLRSLIDIRGFFFDLHLQPKYEQLNFDIRLDTTESPARIRALARETSRRCPQLGLFRLAEVPVLISWYRGRSRTAVFQERYAIARGKTPEDRLIARQKRLAREQEK
jgi:uncharacterized OsmC-like protein